MENNVQNEEKKVVVTSSTETLGEVVTLMERVKGFIDKHGLKGTFTTLLTLFIAAVVGYFIINPSALFETFENFTTEKHNELVKARLQADPYIRSSLNNLRHEIDADRIYLLETHNGGSNLTNLPFLYVDMTYAEPNKILTEYEAEYKNLRLSRYPLASMVYENGSWLGSVENLIDSDPELYYRLKKEGVAYMGMMVMYGKDSMPSGVLGIVYEDEDSIPSHTKIMGSMQKYTNILSPLLAIDITK